MSAAAVDNPLLETVAAILLEHRDADVRDVARLVLIEVRRAYEAWTRDGRDDQA